MRFEDLEVWQRAARLSAELYGYLAELRDFGFREQITKAGLSIPSNIAEGYERDSDKELANFLKYAKGSAGELRSQVYVGMTIGYIDNTVGTRWLREAERISRMLHSLIRTARQEL